MSESPAEPPEWVTGPPEGYDPPPVEDLIDPAVHEQTAARGKRLVLAVLAEECGITKRDDGGWDTPNRGENR